MDNAARSASSHPRHMDLNALMESMPALCVWIGGNWTWRPVFKSYTDELRFEWLALTATVMT